MTTDARGVREIRLGLYATSEQAAEIEERIMLLLCPDPEHASPCPVPWSIALFDRSDGPDPDDPDSFDTYPELIAQAQAEAELSMPASDGRERRADGG